MNARSQGLILIVEDDDKTSSLLRLYLEKEGYSTAQAYHGIEALSLWEKHQPILILLDLMIPHMDGIGVCARVRMKSNVPIIILSSKAEEADKLVGFSVGADDYVVKPFSPREVVARVKAILRRLLPDNSAPQPVYVLGDLGVDLEKHKVTRSGIPLALTHFEFKLLHTFITNPGRVFSRANLLDRLYPNGEAEVLDRTIDVHIRNLREKVEPDPARPCYIQTVRGIGYRFTEQVEVCLES